MPGHPSAYLNVSACYLWEDGDPLHLGGKKNPTRWGIVGRDEICPTQKSQK